MGTLCVFEGIFLVWCFVVMIIKQKDNEKKDKKLKEITKDRDWKLTCFLCSEKQREDLWTRYKKDISYLKSELNKLKEG